MSTDILKNFGSKVRTLRKQRNWSIETLAEESNLHQNYLSDIERGTRNISLKAISKIALGFKISVSELLKDET